MSRSVRYVIGAVLILVLLGAGSGYAVARWGKKDAPPDWNPDWGAVERGGQCVAGELRDVVGDVADFLTPDRPSAADDEVADRNDDPIGGSGDTEAARDTGETTAQSPFAAFLDQSRSFFDSVSDEVPRLDEPAPGIPDGC